MSFVYSLDRVDIQYLSIDIYLIDQKTIPSLNDNFTRNEINLDIVYWGKHRKLLEI